MLLKSLLVLLIEVWRRWLSCWVDLSIVALDAATIGLLPAIGIQFGSHEGSSYSTRGQIEYENLKMNKQIWGVAVKRSLFCCHSPESLARSRSLPFMIIDLCFMLQVLTLHCIALALPLTVCSCSTIT
jgi:hypothetical protein